MDQFRSCDTSNMSHWRRSASNSRSTITRTSVLCAALKESRTPCTVRVYKAGEGPARLSQDHRLGQFDTLQCSYPFDSIHERYISIWIFHYPSRVLNFRRISLAVLGEAERMFGMGFEPQVMKILAKVRPDHQTFPSSVRLPKNMAAWHARL
jgi:hypothetical protein